MPTIDYNIALDMEKSDRSPEMVAARVGDLESVRVVASLTKNGEAYTPSGANAYFECITNAGTSVRVPATKSGTSVSVNIPSQALVKPGVITCAYFRFENGDSSNPTMVESTQSFGIIVPNSIDDEIVAEDYIAEWRGLAQQLEDYVDQVNQAATEAKEDIASDVSSVNSAATSAKGSISSDASSVSTVADEAIAAINEEKQDVQAAADDVTQAGNEAISQFNESSQQAINQFNTNGTAAINGFNTKGDAAVADINSDKDEMLGQAQADVDAKIAALEKATQDAIDAMEAALSEDQYGELLQRLARVWKLDNQDMTDIPSGTDLNTLRAPGTYVCTLDTSAKACTNRPADLSRAFYMFVLKLQAADNIVNQLIIPWWSGSDTTPVKFWMRASNTSTSWKPWVQVGSSTQVSAGKGIIVKKDGDDNEVSIDPDAFYEHVGPTKLATIDTSVTGGGRIKKLKVKGLTRQNLWVNPSGTRNGITVTANDNGSIDISGTATGGTGYAEQTTYALRPGTTYTVSCNKSVIETAGMGYGGIWVASYDSDDVLKTYAVIGGDSLSAVYTVPSDSVKVVLRIDFASGITANVQGLRIMLNEGSEAQPWCPPGLNSVEGLEIVQAGKNFMPSVPTATSKGITVTNNGDGSYTVNGTSTAGDAVASLVCESLPRGVDLTMSLNDGLPSGSKLQVMVANKNGTNTYYDVVIGSNSALTFRIAEDAVRVSVRIGVNGSGITFNNEVFLPQIELGTAATDYEPTVVEATTINLDGNALRSLPDGTCDVLEIGEDGTAGIEQNTQEIVVPNDIDYIYSARSNRYYSNNVFDYETNARNKVLPPWRCDALPILAQSDITDSNGVSYVNSDTIKGIAMRAPGSVSTVEEFKEWLTSLSVSVVAERRNRGALSLPAVTLPALPGPTANVWAVATDGHGNTFTLQPEIEVDVVKTGYLSSGGSDGSGDFEPAFDILPASKGGTGVSTAAAERNRLGLGNTTAALPVANGGTGGTTAKAAQVNILGGMNVIDTDASDASNFVVAYDSPDTTKGAVAKRPATRVWNWIAAKIRSVFGFNASNVLPVSHGGTGATTAAAARSAIGAGTSNFSGDYNDLENKPAIPSAVTYPIPVAKGGTGATTAAAARANLGAGTSNFSGNYADLTGKPTIPSVSYPISVANGGTGVTTAQAERSRLGLGNTTGALPVANGGSGATTASAARNNFGIRSGRVQVPAGSAYEAFSVTVNAGVDCRNKPIFVDSAYDMTDPGKALAQLAVTSRTSTGFVVSGLHGAGSGEYFCWLVIV